MLYTIRIYAPGEEPATLGSDNLEHVKTVAKDMTVIYPDAVAVVVYANGGDEVPKTSTVVYVAAGVKVRG